MGLGNVWKFTIIFLIIFAVGLQSPVTALTHQFDDLADELLTPVFLDDEPAAIREVSFQEIYRRKENDRITSLARREGLAVAAPLSDSGWNGQLRGEGWLTDLQRNSGKTRYILQGNLTRFQLSLGRTVSPWRLRWSSSSRSTLGEWNHPGVIRYGITPRIVEATSRSALGVEYHRRDGWIPTVSIESFDDRLILANPRLEYRLKDSHPAWSLCKQWSDRYRQKFLIRGSRWRADGDWLRPGVWPVGQIGQEEKQLDIRWQGESPGGRRQWAVRYHRGKHGLNGRYLPGRINPLLKFATLSSDFSETMDYRLQEVGIRRRGKTTVAVSLGRLTETSESYECREFILASADVSRQQHSSHHDFLRLEMHRKIRIGGRQMRLSWNQWVPLVSREVNRSGISAAGGGGAGGVAAVTGSRSDSSVRGGTTLTLSLDF